MIDATKNKILIILLLIFTSNPLFAFAQEPLKTKDKAQTQYWSSLMVGYTNDVKKQHWNSDRSIRALYLNVINHFNRHIATNSKLNARIKIVGFSKVKADSLEGKDIRLLNGLRWGPELRYFRKIANNKKADLLQIAGTLQKGRGGRAEINGRHSVVGSNQLLWKIISHELGHNFGAIHRKAKRLDTETVTLLHTSANARTTLISNPQVKWKGKISGSRYSNNVEIFNLNAQAKSKHR